jgi:hypothetical protein
MRAMIERRVGMYILHCLIDYYIVYIFFKNMVNHTPYARSRVRVQPAPKPFKQEALVRLLNSTKFRPITHVDVKLYVDISNGTPEDQWLKTATRQYEKAANAAIHTVLGFDVMP